jgi:putative oxidoreductase
MSSTTIRPVGNAAVEGASRIGRVLRTVMATSGDTGAMVSRLALAVTIFPHGAQKALGWFGGYGFTGTMGFFTQQMGIPAPLAALAIAAEFLGPIALVAGLFGRVAAFGIAVTMAVAALTVHLPNGFFMNWFGAQKGEGVEFFILAIALALVVIIKGSGALSFDRLLADQSER